MQYYEFVGLIPGNLAENEIEPIIKDVVQIFKKAEIEIKREELIGRRKTAYAIEKMRHAYYFIIGFEYEGKDLAEIEKKLKLYKNLIRFLITKTKTKTAEDIAKEKIRLQKQEEPVEEKDKKERRERKIFKPAKKKIEEKKEEKKVEEPKETKKPVDLEQLDKKIDEILDEEIK